MKIEGKQVWQVAAGDTDRNYADICLRWDVILNGPGRFGHWSTGEQKLKKSGASSRKVTDIRRFAERVSAGDVVVLRLGTSDVLGVGEVVGEYCWLDIFGDVDGWDLQHVRRVHWLWRYNGKAKNKVESEAKRFPTYSLKQGDTTQILNEGLVLEWVKKLKISAAELERPITKLPQEDPEKFSLEELSEFLFDKGVASSSIESLVKVIDELTRIAKWYKKFDDPSESETVAYLVVPLFRALGWTPQKMAIEWNHVDVALFESLPRKDESLKIVVEAKKKGNSCLSAVSQAESYAKSRPGCQRLIVTDGIRFGIYLKNDSGFSRYAYMNLTKVRNAYPILECHGVNEAILAMTPEWGEI